MCLTEGGIPAGFPNCFLSIIHGTRLIYSVSRISMFRRFETYSIVCLVVVAMTKHFILSIQLHVMQ